MKAPDHWPDWCAFGFGVLRLPPDQFWAMSLTEWQIVMAGADHTPEPALQASELRLLKHKYPDEKP